MGQQLQGRVNEISQKLKTKGLYDSDAEQVSVDGSSDEDTCHIIYRVRRMFFLNEIKLSL